VEALTYVLAAVIAVTLDLCSFAMLIRAVMPLFSDVENSRIYLFVCLVTEPLIIPVRFILTKLRLLDSSPIDWSFTITYILITLIRISLPAL